jgi:hypothetical protein
LRLCGSPRARRSDNCSYAPRTLTTKLVEAVPTLFVTVQVTVVVPIGKRLPEATSMPAPVLQIGSPPVAVTVKLTRAPAGEVAFTVISPGPLIVGNGTQAGVEIVAVCVRVSAGRVPPFGVTVAVFTRFAVLPQEAETFVTSTEYRIVRDIPLLTLTVSGNVVAPRRVQVKPAGHVRTSVTVAVSLPSAGATEAIVFTTRSL